MLQETRSTPAQRQNALIVKHPSALANHTQTTGTDVFLGGLKNGNATTFAETVCRTASTVISNFTVDPNDERSRSTQANAIIFFNVGDHVVDV
ncbi:MAG TPA: hypothetical protein VE077_14855, partial [Candidatus Methylomirabilis sp.]|nr:hypothetical protein [Candidatus Methylomirabilis sp.]